MPRRSKRKQAKKADNTEEDIPVEEDANQSTSLEESGHDEEPAPEEVKIPVIELNKVDETGDKRDEPIEKMEDEPVENVENEPVEKVEGEPPEKMEDEAEEKMEDEPIEQSPDKHEGNVEEQKSSVNSEEIAPENQIAQNEPTDAPVPDPSVDNDNQKNNVSQEGEDVQETGVEKSNEAESTEVKGESNEKQQEESMETQTSVPQETVAQVAETNVAEVKTQADNDYDEQSSSFVPIEKEPSVPYCYDDDSIEISVDPEGDNGEVLIGNESPDFLKYWRAVLENPQDFTNWTYLLQVVEQENKPSLARRAYNGFFKRYPLCYGYWKKFSELERRNGNYVRAQRILERGVRAIPLSVDLWVHTIDFYINHYKGPDAGREKVRMIFNRAAAAAGEEFRSEKFWNKYLKWIKETKIWHDVMALYDRVLRLPTQHYAVYFKDFKEFVHTHNPQDLIEVDEFDALLEQVRDDIEKKEQEKKRKEEERRKREKKGKEEDKEEKEKEAVKPSDDDPPGVEKDDRARPPNEKEIKAVGEKIILKKKRLYEDTEVVVTKIWTYEEGIKRPYFHVKALERTQIKNWRDYLEAEMAKGEENHRRTVMLFERCLIACALYEDFWLKYARYLMKIDPEKARGVYKRACEIHLPKKPNIHVHWAAFEEIHGNYESAANILCNLEKTLPNLVMVKMRRVAVERRAGHVEAAEKLLSGYVAEADKREERCFFARKYAWFMVHVSKKINEARQTLKDAIARHGDEIQLYKDLVGLEFTHGDAETICAACDLALQNQSLTEEEKFVFSQRKLEYLEDFGNNAKMVQKVYDEHQKLYRSHKKRQQIAAESSQPAKKSKTEPTSPSGGSKIQTTSGARQTYSAKPTTNGNYVAAVAQPQAAAQAYQQTAAATGDAASLYYQNYWNYQQKPEAQQQYQYNQWQQYSQPYYQQ